MLLVDPAAIDISPTAPGEFIVGFQHGRPIDATECRALCGDQAVADATTFTANADGGGAVLASVDLSRLRAGKVAEPGTYDLVLTAPDPEDGGRRVAATVAVTMCGRRSCASIVGVAATITLVPPIKATVSVKFVQRLRPQRHRRRRAHLGWCSVGRRRDDLDRGRQDGGGRVSAPTSVMPSAT